MALPIQFQFPAFGERFRLGGFKAVKVDGEADGILTTGKGGLEIGPAPSGTGTDDEDDAGFCVHLCLLF